MPNRVSLNQTLVSFNYRKRDYIVQNRNTANHSIDGLVLFESGWNLKQLTLIEYVDLLQTYVLLFIEIMFLLYAETTCEFRKLISKITKLVMLTVEVCTQYMSK